MHRVRVHARVAETALELQGEQHVGRLRLPVRLPWLVLARVVVGIVPTDPGDRWPLRADVHDARWRASDQRRHEQVGEQEVAEVVRAELQLETIDRAVERRRHHAGVVDEEVDSIVVFADPRREFPDACQRRQVERSEPTSAPGTLVRSVGGRGVGLRAARGCRAPPWRPPCQCPRRLQADPAGRAGDHRHSSGQVDALDHLECRGRCPVVYTLAPAQLSTRH